jgi:hypothetical protein
MSRTGVTGPCGGFVLRRVVLLLVLLGIGMALAAAAAGRERGTAPKHSVERACKGHARALFAVEQAVSRRAGRLFRPRPWGLQDVADRLATRYADECVALNEIQVLGSHNSYHIEPRWDVLRLVTAFEPEAIAWEYTHLPLDEQFASQGIRQIELDVFADPEGGLYAERQVLGLFGEDSHAGAVSHDGEEMVRREPRTPSADDPDRGEGRGDPRPAPSGLRGAHPVRHRGLPGPRRRDPLGLPAPPDPAARRRPRRIRHARAGGALARLAPPG